MLPCVVKSTLQYQMISRLKMTTKNLNKYLNRKHRDLFKAIDHELLVYGGAGAGKSFSIVDKLLLQSVWQPNVELKTVVIRKTFPSLRNTSLDLLEQRASLFGFPFALNKSDWRATCFNHRFIFQSLNNKEDFEKLKSLTDVDYIWINELPEITEDAYEECLRRLRGGQARFNQLVADFNPIGKTSWVYKRFFQRNIGDVRKLKYTVLDNHDAFLSSEKGQRYVDKLKSTKQHNTNLYNVYFLGEWGELEGAIYKWDTTTRPDPESMDEIFYGGDFGYSVDPAALVRIYRKADEYWVEEVLYETGLTNQTLSKRMHDAKIKSTDALYWDSAEPKSIQEICDAGFNAIPSIKGPDSVRAGIDFLQGLKIHIVEGSENISREQKSYVWKKNKDGETIAEPIGINDHAMSAIRYGITTHRQYSGSLLYTSSQYYKEKAAVSV